MDFRKLSNVSVDCVVFGFDNSCINILLTRRQLCMHDEKYPIIDDWLLTGQHIFKSEKLDESAVRVFKDFTGLDNVYSQQFRTFGNPDRIKNEKDLLWVKSRGGSTRTMSVAYYFLLPTELVSLKDDNLKWFSVNELPQLGFDHKEIIMKAYEDLQQKVMIEPIIFEFLPDKFTLNELQIAYEEVLNIKIDNRNFRKKAIGKKYIVPLEEKRKGISKKPANLYMFSRDIYDRIANKNQIVNI
ncbi:NUDIX hydrolase [Sunxiuqinia sp. A32]|uniref:NUDIX hydrolase n=1 Tax=Sunxiuqinia sp. A32 TaxID=3461496 RepID=UPI0040468145